jgi:hypothetical protein
MEPDAPGVERTVRTIAENVSAGYRRHAAGAVHPQLEQTILARLAEAIRPEMPGGSPGAVLAAANAVLDAVEQQEAVLRVDPRVDLRPAPERPPGRPRRCSWLRSGGPDGPRSDRAGTSDRRAD